MDYDEPPQPVGGFAALVEHLVYPENARKAGLEGRVLVFAHIGKAGKVLALKTGESMDVECDEAALKAVQSTDWNPAKKEGKSLAAWIAIPIDFKMH